MSLVQIENNTCEEVVAYNSLLYILSTELVEKRFAFHRVILLRSMINATMLQHKFCKCLGFC